MDRLTLLIAAAACSQGEIPVFTDTTKHAAVGRGRIVGWDAGKSVKQQGRNEPCQCGSGKKFKKCCLARAST